LTPTCRRKALRRNPRAEVRSVPVIPGAHHRTNGIGRKDGFTGDRKLPNNNGVPRAARSRDSRKNVRQNNRRISLE